MKLANRKPVVFGVVAAFLLVIFLQMFLMARDNSATFDEPFHIYSGYLQWKHGYVTLNPPLITRLITLPLIGMNLPEPPIPRLPYEPLGFQAGKALVRSEAWLRPPESTPDHAPDHPAPDRHELAGTANPKAPLRAVGVSGRQGARLPERREHHHVPRPHGGFGFHAPAGDSCLRRRAGNVRPGRRIRRARPYRIRPHAHGPFGADYPGFGQRLLHVLGHVCLLPLREIPGGVAPHRD